jgi:hypothetical protein
MDHALVTDITNRLQARILDYLEFLRPKSPRWILQRKCLLTKTLQQEPIDSRAANRRAGPRGERGPTMWARLGRAPGLSDRFRATLSRSGCLIEAWGCRLC